MDIEGEELIVKREEQVILFILAKKIPSVNIPTQNEDALSSATGLQVDSLVFELLEAKKKASEAQTQYDNALKRAEELQVQRKKRDKSYSPLLYRKLLALKKAERVQNARTAQQVALKDPHKFIVLEEEDKIDACKEERENELRKKNHLRPPPHTVDRLEKDIRQQTGDSSSISGLLERPAVRTEINKRKKLKKLPNIDDADSSGGEQHQHNLQKENEELKRLMEQQQQDNQNRIQTTSQEDDDEEDKDLCHNESLFSDAFSELQTYWDVKALQGGCDHCHYDKEVISSSVRGRPLYTSRPATAKYLKQFINLVADRVGLLSKKLQPQQPTTQKTLINSYEMKERKQQQQPKPSEESGRPPSRVSTRSRKGPGFLSDQTSANEMNRKNSSSAK